MHEVNEHSLFHKILATFTLKVDNFGIILVLD